MFGGLEVARGERRSESEAGSHEFMTRAMGSIDPVEGSKEYRVEEIILQKYEDRVTFYNHTAKDPPPETDP